MTIALICPDKNPSPWLKAFAQVAPEINVEVWPNIHSPEKVTLALCWQQPEGSLLAFKNLKVICSMGAGVDHLLKDKLLPPELPITRIVDEDLSQGMFEYLLYAVTERLSVRSAYQAQQRQAIWQWQRQTPFAKCHIGFLGLGEIGAYCAQKFASLGFKVSGWSQSEKHIQGVHSYTRDQLNDFVAKPDILVCLLPLTKKTIGILNAKMFNHVKPGCYLINVARGHHLNEADLLTALAQKKLSGACLDVFQQEPLAPEHPFWHHPDISITPHCSSLTRPKSVVQQIRQHYYASQQNYPLNHLVNVMKQY
ncbi:2-hydroxyacid dehydrogenase [Thalassotalea aquiviva]|uniref:2-hydroxyacid dehydrogenase n=1 Tax=Thalassotalea aquiviva TaxID=3242415 RepID=UPI00352A0B70